MEVVISDADQCGGHTVTYCLQPKSTAPTWCKSHFDNTDTYSHANVYVNGEIGEMVDVTDDTDLPFAECTDGNSEDTCAFGDDGSTNSCYALGLNGSFDGATTNVGLKCGDVSRGLCVTVPLLTNGIHAEIIFAVKDKSGCNTAETAQTADWTCSSSTEGGGNSCACSGITSACILEGITSCAYAFCGNGITDPGETCDDGNSVSGDGCSATCEIEPGGGGGQGDPHFKTWRGHHLGFVTGDLEMAMVGAY
jgi:cysteine-rich repeat protein